MKGDKLDHSMSCMQSPFVQQEAKVPVLAETFVDISVAAVRLNKMYY
jgi:hypothetical protein